MRSIGQNLWLDDWHESVVLADGSVSGQSVGGLIDCELAWHSVADLENCSPLGKSASFVIECFCSGSESIQSLSRVFPVGSSEHDKSLVELDSGVDASASEELDKVLTLVSCLVDCLFEHDDSADVLLDAWGLEEELTVCSSVGLVVLDLDLIEPLSDGSRALVSSEDALAWSGDLAGSLDELVSEWVCRCLDHDVF